MSNKAVIGLGFGDEGKGLTTDYLCSQNPDAMVVRFNGGHQAGHTVHYNGIRHVFSNFGSGTLRGNPTYWSEYCTVDPVGMYNEHCILESEGITPTIFINKNCPITTPYDIAYNKITNKHGSCGVGFGATIERNENHCVLTFGDLFYEEVLRIKLDLIRNYYNSKPIELSRFYLAIDKIRKEICLVDDIPKWTDSYIFEGAQGLLLDQDIGFFPHVTRSHTDTTNIQKILQTTTPNLDLYLVTRAYQTRHGVGPMTNENLPHNIVINPNETNVTNYQGEFRRTILDLDLLQYGMTKDPFIRYHISPNLVLTCVDHCKDGYHLTHAGKHYHYNTLQEFAEKIALELDIQNDIILSDNDKAKHTIEMTHSE